MNKIALIGMIGLTLGLGMIYVNVTSTLNVIRYIEKGDAEGLSTCFREDITITLPNGDVSEGVEDCKQTMVDFFEMNPPIDFPIIHRGKRNNSSKKYIIGNYKSTNADFRMTIIVEEMVVDDILIDKEDDMLSQTD